MIETNGLYKSFGKQEVLKAIDLKIGSGGIHAILGPNGSGKTTLIKILLGMVIPTKGAVTVLGTDVYGNSAYRRDLSYLPQIANFPANLKVKELIRMIQDLRPGDTRADELISTFDLEPFLEKKLAILSGGTRQKVNLILAFMFDSPLLILDEPTSGLDPAALLELKALISREKAKGKTILITSHIMQFVEEVADEVIYLLGGNIYFKGSTAKLLEKTGKPDIEQAIATISMEYNG